MPIQPQRQTNVELLQEPFRSQFKLFFKHINDLFHMSVFETVRTLSRQKRLYGYGRTFAIGEKPKTWTMDSEHLKGDAVDLVFGVGANITWAGDRVTVHKIANMYGITPIAQEQCHHQRDKRSISSIKLRNSISRVLADAWTKKQLHIANEALRTIK